MFRALKKLIIVEDPNLIFLAKTRLITTKLEGINVKFKLTSCIEVDRVGFGGGLTFFWNKGIDAHLASCSSTYIEIKVCLTDKDGFCLIGFYGNPKTSMRNYS